MSADVGGRGYRHSGSDRGRRRRDGADIDFSHAPPGAVLTDLSYLVQTDLAWARGMFARVFKARYERLAARYEAKAITPGYCEPLRLALERCDISPSWCGDIAAGTGAATRLLVERFPSSRIVAIDLSAQMLGAAAAAGIPSVVGNAWALPLPGECLDLASVQNAPPGFAELVRVVRPGGTVIFCLSSARSIPPGLRQRLVKRALPGGLALEAEIVAARGVAWLFRRHA